MESATVSEIARHALAAFSVKGALSRIKPLPSRVHIDVTAEDIELGIPRSSNACPIARAAKRVLKGPLGVGVDDICVFSPKEKFYILPPHVIAWRRRFDAKLPVKPISFDTELE